MIMTFAELLYAQNTQCPLQQACDLVFWLQRMICLPLYTLCSLFSFSICFWSARPLSLIYRHVAYQHSTWWSIISILTTWIQMQWQLKNIFCFKIQLVRCHFSASDSVLHEWLMMNFERKLVYRTRVQYVSIVISAAVCQKWHGWWSNCSCLAEQLLCL